MAKLSDTEEKRITKLLSSTLISMDGVCGLVEAGITDKTMSALGRGNTARGIKISLEEDGSLNIVLHINVYYGINIPQLSYDIQSKIKSLIENETGKPVESVNVYVEGVVEKR